MLLLRVIWEWFCVGYFLLILDFGPTKLFFRDKNKKFITVTRGYQIYNYVVYYKVPKEVCGYR